MWVCFPHLTFQFPSSFFRTKVLPLHLQLSNCAVPQSNLPPLEDTIRFHQNFPFWFYLYNIQSITWVASCTYFFKIEIWNILCIIRLGGKSNWYATSPTHTNILNGPQYLGANLAQLPSLKDLFLGFTLTNTCSPTWNSFGVLLRPAWIFCLS